MSNPDRRPQAIQDAHKVIAAMSDEALMKSCSTCIHRFDLAEIQKALGTATAPQAFLCNEILLGGSPILVYQEFTEANGWERDIGRDLDCGKWAPKPEGE